MVAVMDTEQLPPPEFKEPPHSDQLERAVLGCALLHKAAIYELMQYIKTPEVFYRPATRTIWRVMTELAQGGQAVEEMAVLERLFSEKLSGGRTMLDQVGGHSFVNRLPSDAAAASSAPVYAQQLLEYYRRRVLLTETEAARARLLGGADTESVIKRINAGVGKVMESASDEGSTRGALSRFHDNYEARIQGRTGASVRCGHPVVDALLEWEPGELHLLGAYTGMGKTSILAVIVSHMMLNNPELVLSFHQNEVAKHKLEARVVTALAAPRVKEHHIIKPETIPLSMREAALHQIDRGLSWLEDQTCWLHECDSLSLDGIKADAYRLAAMYPDRPRVMVVDYLQEVDVPGADGEYEEIRVATKTLKAIASDTKTIMIVATQMTARSGEVMPLAMPQASQIRGNRKAENAAGRILIWHRPWVKGDQQDFGVLELAKDRYGVPGYIPCRVDLSTKELAPWSGMLPEVPGLYTQEVIL